MTHGKEKYREITSSKVHTLSCRVSKSTKMQNQAQGFEENFGT